MTENYDANDQGREFLSRVRGIIEECSKYDSPAQAARITAFAICVMLDGSGESIGPQYCLLADGFQPVLFHHHDL